jgi:Methylase involved in ubiquinone/menaquinone biosynthesis
VVNLVPEIEKPLVFQEMFRLLKPGGRVAISDILAKRELPTEIKKDLSLYVGCIAGASQVADYEKYLKDAGFQGIRTTSFGVFLIQTHPNFYIIDTMILCTNTDLNIYKEMWKSEKADAPGPTGSCCDPMNHSTEIQDLPDVDFNLWTGKWNYRKLSVKSVADNSRMNLFPGSFKIFAVKPETQD